MAKLDLDQFKNNAESVISTQKKGSGIFKKESMETITTVALDALDERLSLRVLPRDNTVLARSIKTMGQIEPVVVRQQGERYEVLDGTRRIAVAREAGRADIAAEIVDADYPDALFLPFLLNTPEGFDPLEIALYLQRLSIQEGVASGLIEEHTGLKVSQYKELFFTPGSGDLTEAFNAHFGALLHRYFKIKNGEIRIEKDGVTVALGIDETAADPVAVAEVYKFIHKLGNL